MKRQKNQSIEFNFDYVSREMISLKGIEIILLVGRFKSTTDPAGREAGRRPASRVRFAGPGRATLADYVGRRDQS